MIPRWEHEKLLVYGRALEVAAALEGIAATIPQRRADLRDQLRRASASIPLNLAEGAAEFSPPEKARFYRMARRSAAECSAILDLLGQINGESGPIREARASLADMGAMLLGLIAAVQARGR